MISTKFLKFNLSIVRFPGTIPAFESYREVAETVKYGLEALGYEAVLSDEKLMSNAVNIIFGFQILDPRVISILPRSTIFYNLEKMSSSDNFNNTTQYMPILYEIKSKISVWDYNLKNCDKLRQLGITNVVHVPIGYMPETRRIVPAEEQDIDVLFYGRLTERRETVLQELSDAGLKVKILQNIWGIERDRYIARSKVVLNMHMGFFANIFEIVRVSYLLANSKAVVSEYGDSTIIEDDFSDALVMVDYRDLVSACLDLVNDQQKRKVYEEKGFSVMSARDETKYLKAALSKTFNLSENY